MSLLWKVDQAESNGSRVRVRGWCYDTRLPITKVEAVFPEPRATVALASFGLASPDVAAEVDPKADHSRFDEWLEIPGPQANPRFRLQCTLSDGTIALAHLDVPLAAAQPPSAKPAASELDQVLKREAEFRLSMVKEFLDRGERNTYLHSLRREKAALTDQLHGASRDLETLVRRLESESEKAAALEGQLRRLRGSLWWRLGQPFRALHAALFGSGAEKGASESAVPGAAFTYFLHTSPFRVYREPAFTLRGWAWPEDGQAVTGIRVVLDGQNFEGRHGLEEPEVVARYGAAPANPKPGFEVTFPTPPGRHHLSLEAQLDGREWRSILRTSIWCDPTAA